MLKVLLKKQLSEVFKSYFYDAKKNRMRSKAAIAGWFIFFFVIMVGMMGGIFTFLSLSLCESLVQAGVGWLYFLIMGGVSVFLGAFGSVFNTYSGLYLAKDNDLLLSMPIPVRTIMAARLANVYLMGAMYSAVVLLPALIVYWIVAGITAARVVCGLLLIYRRVLFLLFQGKRPHQGSHSERADLWGENQRHSLCPLSLRQNRRRQLAGRGYFHRCYGGPLCAGLERSVP